ncbi:MAG: MlaD family protein [Caldimicrobium sp.]|nr:MlaD family protein [Caldimicrobium sp.]MCX7873753.1 MlaD family protein [Caldimicrobium sp.]MDW8093677.1 MlaD family protein [Caldimicrobium sp.]
MSNRGAVELKVGIFVFLGILALLYLTLQLAQEAFAPKDTYKIYGVFDSVSGLIRGAKVEMAGVPIGKVGDISLTPEGKAKVELLIFKKYKIQEDAVGVVRTFGVLGDKFIEIRPGTSPNYLSEGGTIAKTESPVDLDQILASIGPAVEGLKEVLGTKEGKENLRILVANIRDASESFKKIADKVEKGQGTLGKLIADDKLYMEFTAISQSLKNASQKIEGLANQIDRGEGTLGKLIKDETLYATLKNTASNLERVSKKLEKGEGTLGKLIADEEIYRDLKNLSKDLRNTAQNLDKIVAKIERGEGTLGKLVKDDSLYNEAKRTLRSVNRAAKGVEEQVPITVLGTVAGAAMK